MKLPFTKMHGCGNDYVYFNCFELDIADFSALSIAVSDRHKAIGGDGAIFICPSAVADAQMRMFNIDGSEGMMCGNGIRCVGKYVADHGLATGDTITVETKSGIKTLQLFYGADGKVCDVKVDMGKAEWTPANIPSNFVGDAAIQVPLDVEGSLYTVTAVSMGNPHCVVFTNEPIASLELAVIGPKFEHHPMFPAGVNTEFINVMDDHTLDMRVWERGSGETWACGTGTCAAVAAACENGICTKGEDILVHLRGGDLVINYTDETVYMTGNAVEAFTGFVEVNQ